MKLVVGIGNPGRRYAATRHNVGFDVVNRAASRRGVVFSKFDDSALIARIDEAAILAKPLTYVNASGTAVARLREAFPHELEDLLVVLDDVHLPPGRLRLRASGSDGGHRGLRDIDRVLGSGTYPRLRIGVGAPPEGIEMRDHVLGTFSVDERAAVDAACDRATDVVVEFCAGEPIDRLMAKHNASASNPSTAAREE